MTNKKAFFFALFALLTVLALMGSLAAKAPAKAAEVADLRAWTPLENALASQPAAPQAVCTPDTSPMLSYWPLDETSGTTFTDIVDGNHGTCTGGHCPTPVSGIVGGSQQFISALGGDGITITEDVANPLTWGNEESFSFEMWVNFTESCTGNKVFFGRYLVPGGDPEATWWVGCSDGGFPTFRLKSVSSPAVPLTDDVAINDGAWHHVVAVRDGGAATNRLYIDGTEAASGAASYLGGFGSAGPISIGEYSGGYHFDGQIDEVAVYDKALSPEEVANHYNGGLGQSYCSEPPVAADDALTTDEDTPLDFTADDLLANDSDPDGSAVTISAIDAASAEGGTITDLGSGSYSYAPPAEFSGTDTFTYTITDGSETDTATVSVTVNSVNDPPEAVDQFVTTEEDAAVAITLEASDIEGDALTFSVVDGPLHGTLSGTAPDLTYTPEADYYGPDSFTFKANDGIDDSNVATVTITIDAGPDAVDDSFEIEANTSLDFSDADLLANDTHPEGETIAVTSVDSASVEGGTITDLGGGSFQYTPPVDFVGTDTFTYTVEDESGGTDQATVTVTVSAPPEPGQILLYLPLVVKANN